MKTIIAGGRKITSFFEVSAAIAQSGWQTQISVVVSGGAPGVDTVGEQWARLQGVPVIKFPADWQTHGKSAGPRRNEQMAEYADALILVWDGKSKGSADILRRAKAHGLRIHEHVVL